LTISEKDDFISIKAQIYHNEFLTAVEFVLTSIFFTFNNFVYKQHSAHRCLLFPIIADIIIQDLEIHTLNRFNVL